MAPAAGSWGAAGVGDGAKKTTEKDKSSSSNKSSSDNNKTWVRAVPTEPTSGVTLRKSADGKSLEYVYYAKEEREGGGGGGGDSDDGDSDDGGGGRLERSRLVPGQPPLRLLRRVWVQLSAADSRTHGPRLELTLLDASHPAVVGGGASCNSSDPWSLKVASWFQNSYNA